VDADRGELDGQGAGGEDAALGGVEELGHVAVAGVEGGVSVDQADDRGGEGRVAVAEGFDEDFAEEEGEVRVACVGW
jgi:hypothetical protein